MPGFYWLVALIAVVATGSSVGTVGGVLAWPVVYALMVVVHEGAHLLGATALRLRVREIRIGGGPRLFARQIAGMRIGFHLVPSHGYVLIRPPAGSLARTRRFVLHAAGPVANIVVMVVVVQTRFFGALGIGMLLANMLLSLGSLIPSKVGGMPSDGLAMCIIVVDGLRPNRRRATTSGARLPAIFQSVDSAVDPAADPQTARRGMLKAHELSQKGYRHEAVAQLEQLDSSEGLSTTDHAEVNQQIARTLLDMHANHLAASARLGEPPRAAELQRLAELAVVHAERAARQSTDDAIRRTLAEAHRVLGPGSGGAGDE